MIALLVLATASHLESQNEKPSEITLSEADGASIEREQSKVENAQLRAELLAAHAQLAKQALEKSITAADQLLQSMFDKYKVSRKEYRLDLSGNKFIKQ